MLIPRTDASACPPMKDRHVSASDLLGNEFLSDLVSYFLGVLEGHFLRDLYRWIRLIALFDLVPTLTIFGIIDFWSTGRFPGLTFCLFVDFVGFGLDGRRVRFIRELERCV